MVVESGSVIWSVSSDLTLVVREVRRDEHRADEKEEKTYRLS